MKELKLTINGDVKIFDLPENGEYKVEVVNKYVPKVGDCVKLEYYKNKFFWFKVKEVPNDSVGFLLAVGCDLTIEKDGFFSIGSNRIYTQITPEEIEAKYAEAGYDWDYESDTITPLKWSPKHGDDVWYLGDDFIIIKGYYNENLYYLLEKGLLFRTEEECKKFVEYCLSYFNNKKE